MRSRRWVMSIVLAAVASAASAWIPSAGAVPAPYLELRQSPVYVGESTTLYAGGLEPSTHYEVAVDHGGLGSSRTPTVDVTTGADATNFDVSYVLTTSYPAPAGIHFVLTKQGDSTPLASLSAGVQPIDLGGGDACPGQPVSIGGYSVPDGQYRITDPAGTQFEATGADGHLSGPPIPIPARIPAGYKLTVTEERTGDLIGSIPIEMQHGYMSETGAESPWHVEYTADCFAPGEQVATKPVPGATASTVRANSKGVATIVVTLHPAQHAQSATVTPTGVTSGQTPYPDGVPIIQVPATTLFVNQSLISGGQPSKLASATPPGRVGAFTFHPNGNNLAIEEYFVIGSKSVWFSPGSSGGCDGCRLMMQPDGNLVYRTPSGRALWSTGTATTGSNNRLILGPYGSLTLRTSTGYPVWANGATGLIRGPNGYGTKVWLSATRSDTQATLAGRIRQYTKLGGLVYSGHRKVYVQRYAHGRWTTLLGQTASSTGLVRFTVTTGISYRYRLVVTKSLTAAATQSGVIYI